MFRELLSRGQFLEIIGGRSLKFTAADQVIRLRQFREGLHFRPRPAGPPDKVTHDICPSSPQLPRGAALETNLVNIQYPAICMVFEFSCWG